MPPHDDGLPVAMLMLATISILRIIYCTRSKLNKKLRPSIAHSASPNNVKTLTVSNILSFFGVFCLLKNDGNRMPIRMAASIISKDIFMYFFRVTRAYI